MVKKTLRHAMMMHAIRQNRELAKSSLSPILLLQRVSISETSIRTLSYIQTPKVIFPVSENVLVRRQYTFSVQKKNN